MTAAKNRHRPTTRRPVTAGRVALGLAAALAGTLGACSSVAAAPLGQLDTGFAGGVAELPTGTQLNGAAVQRDGRLVVTGLTNGAADARLLVARFTPQGALDSSFSGDGLVEGPLPVNAVGTVGEAVAIQPDGRIVVAGDVRGNSGADGMLVARLNADGSFDGSFAGGGQAAFLRGSARQAEANAVTITGGGQVIVGGGAADDAGAPTATILRVNAAGGGDGVNYMDIGESTINGVALQADGRIVFAGSQKPGQTVQSFVGRANADGTKDGSFAGGGVLIRQFARNGGARSAFNSVAIQADGRILAAGYAFDNAGAGAPGVLRVTTRVNGDGTPDGSFGPDGVRYTGGARSESIGTLNANGAAGLAADSGHIYTGGSWDEFGSSALAVQAQNDNGDPDGAFGSGGMTVTPVRDYAAPAYGNAIALSPDGLYVVGTTGSNLLGGNTTGTVARFGAHPFAFPPVVTSSGGGGGGGGGGTAPPVVVTPTPKLSKVTVSPKRVRRNGTVTLRYTLSAASSVRLTVERKGTGRRKGTKCVKLTRANRRARSCVLYTRVGTARTLKGRKGANSLRILKRKVTNTTLKPGTYRLVLQVLKAGRPTGLPSRTALTVTK